MVAVAQICQHFCLSLFDAETETLSLFRSFIILQLELDMEQLTGSKLGKEYNKAVY